MAAFLSLLESVCHPKMVTLHLLTDNLGIFSTHHFMNHSCNPNAMNGIMGDAVVEDARVTVWALKKIAKGDEVEISYVDNSMPLQMRRTELKNLYLFDCNCERCVQEEQFDTPPPYQP